MNGVLPGRSHHLKFWVVCIHISAETRHPECPVLDFWQWDMRCNPRRFQEQTETLSSMSLPQNGGGAAAQDAAVGPAFTAPAVA